MLLSRLKSETRDAHERIERDLDLLSDRLTVGRYGAVLAGFHTFLRAWEPCIAAALADDAFFGPRRRLALVEADLAVLRLAKPAPQTVALRFIGDRASAMGSLYVLEGATLGGQLIARHARRTLGLGDAGTAFFRSGGADVGRRWQEFRAAMERCSSPATDDAIVASADATFRSLNAVLGRQRAVSVETEMATHV